MQGLIRGMHEQLSCQHLAQEPADQDYSHCGGASASLLHSESNCDDE